MVSVAVPEVGDWLDGSQPECQENELKALPELVKRTLARADHIPQMSDIPSGNLTLKHSRGRTEMRAQLPLQLITRLGRRQRQWAAVAVAVGWCDAGTMPSAADTPSSGQLRGTDLA